MQFRELQKVVNERGEEAFDTNRKCCQHGWYSWSCSDESLKNRTKKFFPLIKGIKEGGKVGFNWHAWFSNNRPLAYSGTYDQMRISSDRQDELIIRYKEPYHDETWVVYSSENYYGEPVAQFGNVYKLIAWLNEKGE